MSFGYSVGDFIQLVQLSWTVYKAYKDAPASLRNISNEVLSLHAVLKEAEESIFAYPLPHSTQANLREVGQGCYHVLTDLQKVIRKYDSLSTNSQRTWERLRWGAEDIEDLRSRLITNVTLLNTFISLSQFSVRKKLDSLLKRYNDDQEGSIDSSLTIDTLSSDDKQMWRSIRKELEGIGISVAAFDANREFIMNWFVAAVAKGEFQEPRLVTNMVHIGEGKSNSRSPQGRSQLSKVKDMSIPEHITQPKWDITEQKSSVSFQAMTNPLRERGTEVATMMTRWIRPKKKLVDCVLEDNLLKVYQILDEAKKTKSFDRQSVNIGAIMAIKQGKYEMTKIFLDNIVFDEAEYYHALQAAFASGHSHIIELLLEQRVPGFSIVEWYASALPLASFEGDQKKAILLLDKYSYVSDVDDGHSVSKALEAACVQGHFHIAELLLKDGTDRSNNLKLDALNDALCTASTQGNLPIVQLLVNKGADINKTRYWFGSPLQAASFKGHEKVVRFLLDHGANVNLKNYQLGTALQAASLQGHDIIIELLINRGANVNSKCGKYGNALQAAAFRGRIAVARQLLAKGADVNALGGVFRNALEAALHGNHLEVANMLREHGLSDELRDKTIR